LPAALTSRMTPSADPRSAAIPIAMAVSDVILIIANPDRKETSKNGDA
jgi:hypothetical protein